MGPWLELYISAIQYKVHTWVFPKEDRKDKEKQCPSIFTQIVYMEKPRFDDIHIRIHLCLQGAFDLAVGKLQWAYYMPGMGKISLVW